MVNVYSASDAPEVDVLIVGAGIAGLAVQRGLASSGLSVAVVDRKMETPQSGGSGIVLHPNGQIALRNLGVNVSEFGHPLSTTLFVSHTGVESIVNWNQVWTAGIPFGMSRVALVKALSTGAESISIDSPVSISTLTSDRTLVTMQSGATYAARMVVAADGINSWFRRTFYPGLTKTSTGHVYARSISKRLPSDEPWEVISVAPGLHIGSYAVSSSDCHVFLQSSLRKPVDEILVAISQSAGYTQKVRAIAEALLTGGYRTDHTDFHSSHVWHHDRIVFTGDSSHALSPSTSQGGGTALEDAALLTAAIRHSSHNLLAAAGRYHSLRSPRMKAFGRAARLNAVMQRDQLVNALQTESPTGDAMESWYRTLYAPLTQTYEEQVT